MLAPPPVPVSNMQSRKKIFFFCFLISVYPCIVLVKFPFNLFLSQTPPLPLWCSTGSPVNHYYSPHPLSQCGSLGPLCFIINKSLCRHVLLSQHITLTCTGGILPQFCLFIFRLTTALVMDGEKEGRERVVFSEWSNKRELRGKGKTQRSCREGCGHMLACCNAVWFRAKSWRRQE